MPKKSELKCLPLFRFLIIESGCKSGRCVFGMPSNLHYSDLREVSRGVIFFAGFF